MSKIPAILLLQDGTLFEGYAVGQNASGYTVGECVFNTSMSGYQEVVTDPSYRGQLVTFTYPHIGNYGANDLDHEGPNLSVNGMIMRSCVSHYSNQRATMSFADYLGRGKVIGIEGVDTRGLTRHLRDHGVQMGIIAHHATCKDREKYAKILAESKPYGDYNFLEEVAVKVPYRVSFENDTIDAAGFGPLQLKFTLVTPQEIEEASKIDPDCKTVVVVDFGCKYSIYRSLLERSLRVVTVPYTLSYDEIVAFKPDAILISNGPGDPEMVENLEMIRRLSREYPTFGICLGHQILGRAYGGKTFKLQFGHRGPNQPVLDQATGVVMMTSQNHGYAVSRDDFPDELEVISHNLNDDTISGLRSKKYRFFSVQYHPEAGPGPNDAKIDFDRFCESF